MICECSDYVPKGMISIRCFCDRCFAKKIGSVEVMINRHVQLGWKQTEIFLCRSTRWICMDMKFFWAPVSTGRRLEIFQPVLMDTLDDHNWKQFWRKLQKMQGTIQLYRNRANWNEQVGATVLVVSSSCRLEIEQNPESNLLICGVRRS